MNLLILVIYSPGGPKGQNPFRKALFSFTEEGGNTILETIMYLRTYVHSIDWKNTKLGISISHVCEKKVSLSISNNINWLILDISTQRSSSAIYMRNGITTQLSCWRSIRLYFHNDRNKHSLFLLIYVYMHLLFFCYHFTKCRCILICSQWQLNFWCQTICTYVCIIFCSTSKGYMIWNLKYH